MTGVRLSVILPTIGRTSLGRALASCKDAFEVLVDHNHDRDRGYAARERMIARATGTHLCFLDDDDVYTQNAIGLFTEAACDVPVIFRMRYHHGGAELWQREEVMFGNVGTPMFLVPNDPERLGHWHPWEGSDSGGDCSFITGCVEKMGQPVWRTEIVCVVKPA